VTSNNIDKGTDSVTELPQFFTNWRLKVLSSPAVNPDGVDANIIRLLLRADTKGIRQDWQAMRQTLEEATARDKRLIPATITLAMLYEQSGEYDKAIERYRTVLEKVPTNIVALNNLAYALAARKNSPQEGLPLAEKAYSLAPKNPSIADTLAWILHLAGNDRRALGLLAEAIQIAPQNATTRLHSAIVHAALGENQEAQQELSKALELEPTLATSNEVQQLRTKLKLP
jgi:Tfp pilus assembly protein PilF